MTTTTLERVELTVEDFAIGCECFLDMPCDNTATHVINFDCHCIRLNCMSCVSKYLVYLGSGIGRRVICMECGHITWMFEISDVVKSITPL